MTFEPLAAAPVAQTRWIEFVNDSGETIPAHAVMRPTGTTTRDGRVVLQMDKPSDARSPSAYVNGPVDVAEGAFGVCSRDFPLHVLYDTDDGTPDVGDCWGLKADSWKMRNVNSPQFSILDVTDSLLGLAFVGRPEPFGPEIGVVRVRNDSGGDVVQYQPLGISGPVTDPSTDLDEFLREVALKGVTPSFTDPDYTGKICITLEKIADGDIGRAAVSGVVPVQVYIDKDDGRIFADAFGSGSALRLVEHGSCQILWKQSGVGSNKWAYVRLANVSEIDSCGTLPLTDNFDDVNGTLLSAHYMDRGCGWQDINSGAVANYTIQGNKLEIAATSNSNVMTNAKSSTHTVSVTCEAGTATTTINVRTYTRVKSSANHWRAVVALNASNSTISLIESTSSTNTTRASQTGLAAAQGTTITIAVTDNGTTLGASVSGGVSGAASYGSSQHGDAKAFGLGHGVSGTYTANSKFTQFLVQ